MSDMDWRGMPHEVPEEMQKYLIMLCSAGDAKNELILLTRYQKIVRKIHDDELTKLKQAIAILLEANEFYANKENCNNAESCFVYEIDPYSGDEVADEGYHARDAKKQVDLILGLK